MSGSRVDGDAAYCINIRLNPYIYSNIHEMNPWCILPHGGAICNLRRAALCGTKTSWISQIMMIDSSHAKSYPPMKR